eukprot:752496-Hanusia_phi.AAC.3
MGELLAGQRGQDSGRVLQVAADDLHSLCLDLPVVLERQLVHLCCRVLQQGDVQSLAAELPCQVKTDLPMSSPLVLNDESRVHVNGERRLLCPSGRRPHAHGGDGKKRICCPHREEEQNGPVGS